MSRRDEVLRAALELLDEVGIDALTTRRLAERLNVQPGALYRHFASKRELLDAMVERIAASSPTAATKGTWSAQLRSGAHALRDGMLAHRDGARLMATFANPGPAAAAHWQQQLKMLQDGGLTAHAANVALDTLIAYVNGFVIEEQSRSHARARAERDAGFAAGVDVIIRGIEAGLSEAPKRR